MDISLTKKLITFSGSVGSLSASLDDPVTLRLAMLIEGQCDLGATLAAEKYGLSRPRYYQLLDAYEDLGAEGLILKPRGPKSNYRRTDLLIRLIIRYRFLDPDCSPHVIFQKLQQGGHPISIRSVERVIADFGLQKKTLCT